MKRIAFALFVLVASFGCQSQPELVGDTKIRRYFPNTPESLQKIPESQRIYFEDADAAHQRGYVDYREKQTHDSD